MIKATIQAIAAHLPATQLTNDQLAGEFGDGWDAKRIFEKTGIASRRVSLFDECASDLGVCAAQKLFASGACNPEDVDFLIFCTQTPDYLLPSTACLVQERLRLGSHCGAIDINQGCSGFVYGLAMAKGLIESRVASHVLLITADTYTKLINSRDKSARTIFGDGASATLLSPTEAAHDMIGPMLLGSDGRGARHLIVPSGGLRCPPAEDTQIEREDASGNWRSDRQIYMNGGEVFNFTIKVVPSLVRQLLAKADLQLQQIDHFIFHQANKFMLEHLRSRLAIDPEKFIVYLENSGNTVSSTIPIALEHLKDTRRLCKGEKLMLVGFGVGFSWAAAIVEVTN